MSEWWSYSLSDFLLFSPRTYYRLFERMNAELWPVLVLTVCLGLVMVGLLRRETPRRWRFILASLSLLWMLVALVFLWRLYGSINWAAKYFAWGFMLESALLMWSAVAGWKVMVPPVTGWIRTVGYGLLVFSVALYPFIPLLVGRPWQQAEVFGLAPDPTVIGTLGILLIAPVSRRWRLLPIPLIWCIMSGLTLLAMGSTN